MRWISLSMPCITPIQIRLSEQQGCSLNAKKSPIGAPIGDFSSNVPAQGGDELLQREISFRLNRQVLAE
jgi:hypothetical protein